MRSSSLGVKFSDVQKKQLEKVYAKIFDLSSGAQQPTLTEEGRNLCHEADVSPQDLLIKTYNDFE